MRKAKKYVGIRSVSTPLHLFNYSVLMAIENPDDEIYKFQRARPIHHLQRWMRHHYCLLHNGMYRAFLSSPEGP